MGLHALIRRPTVQVGMRPWENPGLLPLAQVSQGIHGRTVTPPAPLGPLPTFTRGLPAGQPGRGHTDPLGAPRVHARRTQAHYPPEDSSVKISSTICETLSWFYCPRGSAKVGRLHPRAGKLWQTQRFVLTSEISPCGGLPADTAPQALTSRLCYDNAHAAGMGYRGNGPSPHRGPPGQIKSNRPALKAGTQDPLALQKVIAGVSPLPEMSQRWQRNKMGGGD